LTSSAWLFAPGDGDREITVPDHPLLTIGDPATKTVAAKPGATKDLAAVSATVQAKKEGQAA
jgi:hypothetical protein